MHAGIQLAIGMWAMTALSLTLVALRLYTRVRIVRFVGVEDHMYAWTGLFLLIFTCAIQVSVHFGFGQNFWTLSVADSSDAIFWTYVANSFAIIGNAMAKLSMGLFLLRVVQLRWHKISLWTLVIITTGTSIALTVILWNQTTPRKASWDPLRTPGKWNIQMQPISVGLGVWSSACDFFFAIFPWLFIWSLRMSQRDKIMLAGGMSLGVIAGACGIIRTVVLSRLDVYNYTQNFVPYFAWAGGEIAIAMICVGIPTLRPLYLRHRGGSIGYTDHETCASELPQFTMCDPKPAELSLARDSSSAASRYAGSHYASASAEPTDPESGGGLGSPTPGPGPGPARPPSAHTRDGQPDSVDEILGLYVRNPNQQGGVIWVKNEVHVQRDYDDNWPLKD